MENKGQNPDNQTEQLKVTPQNSSQEMVNPPPEFIEVVLRYIFNIYQREFEEKKMLLETEEEQANLQMEDVFDENDRKLIEELTSFIESYQYSQVFL